MRKEHLLRKIVYFLIITSLLLTCFNNIRGEGDNRISSLKISPQEPVLEPQLFSKEDFEPILEEERQGLGSVSITNLLFNESGFFNHSEQYPAYDLDLRTKALNISYEKTELIRTVKEATVDAFEEVSPSSNIITVELNESLRVKYDTSIDLLEGYLVYGPRLYPCLLNRLYAHNASSSIKEVYEGNYTIDDRKNVIFYYSTFFNGAEQGDFKLYLIWHYNITLEDWTINQVKEEDLFMSSSEQNITATFNYNFNVLGKKLKGEKLTGAYPFTSLQVAADNLNVTLRINMPDRELLENHAFTGQGYVGSNNIIYASFSVNNSLFDMDFDATFTIEFLDPVNVTWAIDRLIEGTNYRERIYFPNITWGPEQLFLKYVKIEERTISIDQIKEVTSQFGRVVEYVEKNFTEFQQVEENSLIFTEKVIQRRGLEITLPYFIKGETCPFRIKYEPSEDLRVIITDNIRMPLRNVEVKILYYGRVFGTYISNTFIQPTSITKTDENGEIFIQNVPNGDYTVILYEQGTPVYNSTVMAYKRVNYVITDISHFPLVILSFLIPSAIFLILGVLIYLHYKKERETRT
ncbi:MAG: hypothetical protein ACTSU4_13670 [Promethearchaeota archaeon]